MRYVFFLLLSILFCLPAGLHAQWQHLGSGFNQPPEGKIGILDMAVIDTNTIWALPELSYTFARDSVQRISRTLDGGKTWQVDTIDYQEGFENTTLFARNADTAWVVTQKQSLPHHSKIYRTNDGGATWAEQPGPFNTDQTNIRKIHFFNAQVGVAYGNKADFMGTNADSLRIYRTTNGGMTWNQIHRTQLPAVTGRELGNGGCAFGDTMWIGTHTGRIWRSFNQGQSWTASTFPVTGGVAAIQFKNHLDGIAVSSSQTIGARTTNGGNTWTSFTTPFKAKLLEYIPGTVGSYLLVANNVWQNPIYITYNNGGNWDRYRTGYSCYTKSIKIQSSTEAYISTWVGNPSQGGIFQWTGDFDTLPGSCWTCQQEITEYPYVEDFEGTGGDWCQDGPSWGIEWLLNTGNTPYNGTGPDSAFSGTHYLYMESAAPGNYPNQQGIHLSPCFKLDSTCMDSASFTFNYHMYGLHANLIRLFIYVDGGPSNVLWDRIGNQGNQWNKATIDLKPYVGHDIRITFGAFNTGQAAAFAMDNIRIDAFSKLEPALTVTDPACFGDSTGQVNLQVGRGAPPYQYHWSTGDTIANLSAVPAGSYLVDIRDANGCEITDSVTIFDPPAISGTVLPTAVRCNGMNDGKATATIQGGTGNLHYLWSTGDTVPSLSALPPGNYTVNITDDQGCLVTDSALVTEPLTLLGNPISQDVFCVGDTNGWISLIPDGGNPPYSYGWSGGGGNDSTRFNLSPGRYTYILTDRKNCFTSGSVLIQEPDSLKADFTFADVSCFGLTDGMLQAQAQGGTSPFSYQWSTGATGDSIALLGPGVYALQLVDTNGCSWEDSIAIQQPDSLWGDLFAYDVSCYGGNDGAIKALIFGGNGGNQFQWSHSGSADSLPDLTAGTYHLRVTDSKGCQWSDSASIAQPDSFFAAFAPEPDSIPGGMNASVTLTVDGGTAPYTFLWSNGDTAQNPMGLANQQTYTVIITDARGCELTDSVDILGPGVGLEEAWEKISLKMYPNPAKEKLYISFDSQQSGKAVIQIYDLTGKLLREVKSEQQNGLIQHSISVSQMPAGTYLLKISGTQTRVWAKWVKL